MRKYILILILLLVIGACSSPNGGLNSHDNFTTPIVETAMVTKTTRPTLTTQPTMTPSITPSPLPTLEADEAILVTQGLLENNNSCEFPCWWGIVPGETSWKETERFLSPFVLSIQRIYETELEQTYLIVAPVSEKIDLDGTFDFAIELDNDNNGAVVQQILIPESYQSEIPVVLLNYGEPDQIWFWTNGPSIYNEGYLILFYQDRGMMFTYMGEVSLRGNDSNEFYFEVCSSSAGNLGHQIKLWRPAASKDFYSIADELLSSLALTGHRDIRQLEQISNTSVHEFYIAVLDRKAKDDFCFQSDVEYWELEN